MLVWNYNRPRISIFWAFLVFTLCTDTTMQLCFFSDYLPQYEPFYSFSCKFLFWVFSPHWWKVNSNVRKIRISISEIANYEKLWELENNERLVVVLIRIFLILDLGGRTEIFLMMILQYMEDGGPILDDNDNGWWGQYMESQYWTILNGNDNARWWH